MARLSIQRSPFGGGWETSGIHGKPAMKILLAILLMMAAPGVHAGCSELANGDDGRLRIDISDGGCADPEMMITVWKREARKDAYVQLQKVPFARECVVATRRDGTVRGFSCSARGHTLLAGRTYRRVATGHAMDCAALDPAPREFHFVCVRGCSRKSPLADLPEQTQMCD